MRNYNEEEFEYKPKKRRKSHKLRNFVICLILIAAIVAGLWYFLVGVFYKQMNYHEIPSVSMEALKEDGVINVLLIGNDSRSEGEDGRSDAMILLSISNETKSIHLTSLLRDIYVDIPGYDGNRLNAAYAYGGAELLLETIEANFDIEVNRYAQVNFQAFANLVDAVGGVDLELSNEEVKLVNGYLWEYNILEGKAEGTDYLDENLQGMLHLNGPQALAYCRNRYIGDDFGRTERQRKVLSAMVENAPNALFNMDKVVSGIFSNVTTNLTQAECVHLSTQVPKFLTYDIVQGSIPLKGTYSNASIRGMSVLQVDFDANNEYIRKEIYGDDE